MGGKKAKPSEDQIGLDASYPEFDVPVVLPARTPKAAFLTSALDLTKRPQTWLKLLSLGEYLPVWFGKISNLHAEAYYLDFFAGPGIYTNGLMTAKGSPVLACEAAAAMVDGQAARGRVWTPHLRFVEPDKDTRRTLTTELARFDGVLDYRVIAKTAEDALPALLRQSATAPTLAFFDPFGYDVHFDWITAFKRPGINEVLVSFDAQGIVRNHGHQPVGVTAFSGGEWWREHVKGSDLDLDAYLRDQARHLRRVFGYAGIQQFEFLSNHALRAVLQCCGSVVGREVWLAAVRKSRDKMALVGDTFFPELDEQTLMNEILDRLRGLVGTTVIFKEIIGHLDDLDWNPSSVNQALAFLAECGFVTWSDRKAAAGHPYRLFRFTRPWPAALAWDGVTRAVPERPSRSAVTTAR